MLIPVRCFTCNKVVGSLWEKYQKLLSEGKNPEEAFKELNIKRYCCRRMLVSHVELVDKIIKHV